MDIKCNTNPYYFITPPKDEALDFRGGRYTSRVAEQAGLRVCKGISAGLSADKFVRRPVATKSATGLQGLKGFAIKALSKTLTYLKAYQRNIQHTFDHKIVFAMVEKELFGKISMDSITHDADKLILYILGFPKSFVSKFHRLHSEHHVESGKTPNLRSMICDNIASSPDFKPEKTRTLREHFAKSPELQKVKGFKEVLEKYNYGESIDFEKIKMKKSEKYKHTKGAAPYVISGIAFISALFSELA